MPNFRRFFRVFLGCLILGGLVSSLLRAAGDAPTPAEAPALKLKVDRPEQPILECEAKFTACLLKTNYGLVDLDLSKVKSLTVLSDDGEGLRATAELTDHNHVSGVLKTLEFAVVARGEPLTIPAVEGLSIQFLHPVNTGLLAALFGLLTLTVMEIVLGVDNVIFLAIVAGKLPEAQQPLARRIGLAAALGTRILLLFTLTWLMGATKPLFTLPELPFLQDPESRGISIRDLILLVGGLFLIGKSTKEIHEKVAHAEAGGGVKKAAANFAAVIVQIAIVDIVFSLDSVITAVGMVEELWVMIVAMVIAAIVMVIFAEPISRFVEKTPTVKILALSFLILIGALLVAEGLGQHLDKGYIYFAMAFAVVIELINIRMRPKPEAVV